MKKRILCAILASLLAFQLIACGKSDNSADQISTTPTASISPSTNSEANAEPESSHNSLEVDKSLLDVTITLPKILAGEHTASDMEAFAKENNYKSASLNQDGSVTVVMSKSRHKELTESLNGAMMEYFDELPESVDAPYIKSISESLGYKQITITVDKDGYYENDISNTGIKFIVSVGGAICQAFDGQTPSVDIDVVDALSGKVIDHSHFPEPESNDDPASTKKDAKDTYETVQKTKLYQDADKESDVLSSIPEGTKLNAIEHTEHFAKVEYDGNTGYVRLKHCK